MSIDPATKGKRRDIICLGLGTQQQNTLRTQFIWCVKMLGIIPAFFADSPLYYKSLAPEGLNKVQPKCLQDELISFFYTTNLQNTWASAYYNRHFLIVYEMFLNYVHSLLCDPNAANFKTKFPGLINTPAKENALNAILLRYSNCPYKAADKMMAHYWNPTHTQNPLSFTIPVEFRNIRNNPDSMDTLFYLIRGHYPDQINPRLRWYSDPASYNKAALITELVNKKYFLQQDIGLLPNEESVLKGELTARTPNRFLDYYNAHQSLFNPYDSFNLPTQPKFAEKNAYQNYLYFNTPKDGEDVFLLQNTNNITQTDGITPFQHNKIHAAWFGGKIDGTINQKYFTESQISSAIQTQQYKYNESLPNYQLAFSLYNYQFQTLPDFLNPTLTKGFEWPSRTVYSNLNFISRDSSYGPTSFLFFLYQSWVDATFEIKIRTLNASTDLLHGQIMADFLNYNTYEYFDKQLQATATKTFGQLPINQWIDPATNDPTHVGPLIEVDNFSMTYKDISLTSTNRLLLSTQLQDVYSPKYINQSGLFIINNQLRFKPYQGFKAYNANYDYLIYENRGVPQQYSIQDIINGTGGPSLIKFISNQVNQFQTIIQQFSQQSGYGFRFGQAIQRGDLSFYLFNNILPRQLTDRKKLIQYLTDLQTYKLINQQQLKYLEWLRQRQQEQRKNQVNKIPQESIKQVQNVEQQKRQKKKPDNDKSDKFTWLVDQTDQKFNQLPAIDFVIRQNLMHPRVIYHNCNVHHCKDKRPPYGHRNVYGAQKLKFDIVIDSHQELNSLSIDMHMGIKKVVNNRRQIQEVALATQNILLEDIKKKQKKFSLPEHSQGNNQLALGKHEHYQYKFDFCNLRMKNKVIVGAPYLDGAVYYRGNLEIWSKIIL